MTAANGRADRKNRRLARGVVFPALEGLENRTLLSAGQLVAVPIPFATTGNSPAGAAPVFATVRSNVNFSSSTNESAPAHDRANRATFRHETTQAALDSSNGAGSTAGATFNLVATEQSGGWWAVHGSGRPFHDDWDARGSNSSSADDTGSGNPAAATPFYVAQQGSIDGVEVIFQPDYVLPGGPVTAVFETGLDRLNAPSPAVAAATAPVESGATAAATAKVSKAAVQADLSAITTSQPQRNDALAQSLIVGSIAIPITSGTPHTHVQNNLVLETWQTAVDNFSKTPIVRSLDWEIAVATNAVSASASANFVQNLVISDASAMAHVANTLAVRLFDENSMLWKESAAFIGTAVLVGSYVAKSRLQTEDPPRKKRVQRKHVCVGE